jgi:hypothetical protein
MKERGYDDEEVKDIPDRLRAKYPGLMRRIEPK